MNSKGRADRVSVNYDIPTAVRSLASTAEAIQSLTEQIGSEQARWKPRDDVWSIVEVVNHLVDEEIEDFRTRLDLLLHDPGREFPPIDPAGAVTERRYAERDIAESVGRFMEERGRSIGWLNSLEDPDLERSREHASMGTMSARQLLANWVAHDLHHLRQITRLHYEHLSASVAPISLEYAGNW